jgi:hypothetical protein
MKKKLALSLAFAFTMGLAGTAFADSNPFVDVPKGHWSYDAVTKLAKDKIVDGYADKTFQGDKEMTRYEMAQAVAKAVSKADKASAEDKALIQKLYTEYKDELKGMNVRVSSLEGEVKDLKEKADHFDFSGQLRASYQDHKVEGVTQNDGQNRFYLCLEGVVKINDNWKAHFYNETSQYYGWQRESRLDGEGAGKVRASGLKDASGNEIKYVVSDPDNSTWKRTWVSGKVGTVGVDFGKKWYSYGYNTAVGIQGTGFNANFALGNNATADVFYFKPSWGKLDIDAVDGYAVANMYGAHFNIAASKTTNVNLLIGGNDKRDALSNHISSWAEIGFDTKLSPDFKFTAAYGKTNADDENRNIYARLDYKGVDQNVKGSYGIFLRYFDRQLFGDPCGDDEDGTLGNGWKTIGLGAEYAVAKNIVWQNVYYHQKSNVGADVSSKIFRSHLDFHF